MKKATKAVKVAKKTVRPRGRPTVFSQKVADEICNRLAQGETLKAICRDPGMPSDMTVRVWARDDKFGFYSQYARARDIGLDVMADQLIEIAQTQELGKRIEIDSEGRTKEVVEDMLGHRRLKVDTFKWYLAKMAPKRYGDRQHIEHSVDEDLAKVIAASRARSGIKG